MVYDCSVTVVPEMTFEDYNQIHLSSIELEFL